MIELSDRSMQLMMNVSKERIKSWNRKAQLTSHVINVDVDVTEARFVKGMVMTGFIPRVWK